MRGLFLAPLLFALIAALACAQPAPERAAGDGALAAAARHLRAAGAGRRSAAPIAALSNVFDEVAEGAGARLPRVETATTVSIINKGANPLLVYPPDESTIAGMGEEAPLAVPPGSWMRFRFLGAEQQDEPGALSGWFASPVLPGRSIRSERKDNFYVGYTPFQHTELNPSGAHNFFTEKVGSAPTDQWIGRSFYRIDHVGGSGGLLSNWQTDTSIVTTPRNNVWANFFATTTSGRMNAWTQEADHVGFYDQLVRHPFPAGTAVASASRGTSVAVQDTSAFRYGYATGYAEPVSPANPVAARIDGRPYAVTGVSVASGPGRLTLAAPLSGSDGAAGQAVEASLVGVRMEAEVIEAHDFNDCPTSVCGPVINTELDMAGNGPDDIDFRAFLSLDLSRSSAQGSAYEVGNGIGVYAPAGTALKRFLQMNGPYTEAILDDRKGVRGASAHTIWFAAGDDIAFDAKGARTLLWNRGTQRLEYRANGAEPVFGLADDGAASFGAEVRAPSFAPDAPLAAGRAALDARSATLAPGANAVWLPSNGPIALDTEGKWTVRYDQASSRVKISFGGTDLFSIDGHGNVRARGAITGGTTP